MSKFFVKQETVPKVQCLSLRTNDPEVTEVEFYKFIAYVAPLVRQYNTVSKRKVEFKSRIEPEYVSLFQEEDQKSYCLEKPRHWDTERVWFIFIHNEHHEAVLNVLDKITHCKIV